MSSYSRFQLGSGPSIQPMQQHVSPAITPIPVEWWLAGQQDIRKYMGSSKESALSFIRQSLTFMVTAFKKLLADGEEKFNYQQAQYVNDQIILISAMAKVMTDTYQFDIYSNAIIKSLIYQIVGDLDQYDLKENLDPKALRTQFLKFCPDIGQFHYLTDLLAYRSSRGDTVLPYTFHPQFTVDKTPILITPHPGTPGSNLTVQDDTTPAKSNTLLYVGIAAIVAYLAFKG